MKTLINLSRCIFFCILLQTITGTCVFAQTDRSDTTDNDTYGAGGSKITRTYDDAQGHKLTTITIKDAKKIIREYHETEVINNAKRQYDAVFDEINIDPLHGTEAEYDLLGTETKFRETRFKNGDLIYGFKWHLDDNGKKITETWDGKKWVEKKGDVSYNGTENIADRSSGNLLFGGFSVIREDSQPGFFTYGPEVQFRHFISNQIALSADLGLTFGNSMQVDYTKKVIMVGAVAELLDHAEKNQSKLDVNVHAYGGVSFITSSFNFASTDYKYTSNVFTADVGVGAGLPLNSDGTIMVAANVDYIPTISSMVKSNFRASLGLNFWFKRGRGHH